MNHYLRFFSKTFKMLLTYLSFLLLLVTWNSYANNEIRIFNTIGGSLKLIGDDDDYVMADNMAVYLNDTKLFSADNPPVLHAYFSGLFHGDVAVIGMCANGGCLYRVIQISSIGSSRVSQSIGFARIERATITHDFDTVKLNDLEYKLDLKFSYH